MLTTSRSLVEGSALFSPEDYYSNPRRLERFYSILGIKSDDLFAVPLPSYHGLENPQLIFIDRPVCYPADFIAMETRFKRFVHKQPDLSEVKKVDYSQAPSQGYWLAIGEPVTFDGSIWQSINLWEYLQFAICLAIANTNQSDKLSRYLDVHSFTAFHDSKHMNFDCFSQAALHAHYDQRLEKYQFTKKIIDSESLIRPVRRTSF